MNLYYYNYEKAKKYCYSSIVYEIFKIIIVASIIFGLGIFLGLKYSLFFIYFGMIVSFIYICIKIYNIICYRNITLTAIAVDKNNNSIYILKNNNIQNFSWINTIRSKYGNIINLSLNIMAAKKELGQYDIAKKIMQNEEIIKFVIENPNDKLSKGIEKYQIIKVNDIKEYKNKIVVNFEGFELGTRLLFKKEIKTIFNVYDDYEELINYLKKYNEYGDKQNIEIDEKKMNKYRKLYQESYKKLNFFYKTYLIFNIINLLINYLYRFNLFVINTLLFCLILMFYTPSKNTDLNGEGEYKKILYNSIIVTAISLIIIIIINIVL